MDCTMYFVNLDDFEYRRDEVKKGRILIEQ